MITTTRHRIDITHESRPMFRDAAGLELHACFDSKDPIFESFYIEYNRTFVLPDETEKRHGFEECLKLNHGHEYQRLASLYGSFREPIVIAVLRDRENKPMTVGGANFISYPLIGESGDLCLALNLNYIFVTPEWRGKQLLRRILAACEGLAEKMYLLTSDATSTTNLPVLMFMELNDPFRLTQAQYELDSSYTGIDQFQRLGVWARMAARIVDFPYIQPPLSDNQVADDSLALALIGGHTESLPACQLFDHLERFFSISILKGKPLKSSKEAMRQLSTLKIKCAGKEKIALLDMAQIIGNTERISANFNHDRSVHTLREYLRANEISQKGR
jgi:GNAT superfamily N-acetyltransferase